MNEIPGRKAQVLAMATLVAAGAILAGCSSNSDGTTSTATKLQVTTPAANGAIGTLKWALPFGEPTSLDPAKVGDYSPSTVESNLCEGLVSLDANFRAHPNLAAKISSPNDTTMVFDLRSNATFWDGKPVTAADVVYSLERNLNPKVGSFWGSSFSLVKSIKATGAHQVTVGFKKPDTDFKDALGTPAGAISEKSFVERTGTAYGTAAGGVMCTGPYKLRSWRPGQSITLSKNTSYWNSALKAKAQKVVFSFVTDSSTLTTALESRQFDGAYEVPVATAAALRRGNAGTVYAGPSTQMVELIPTEAKGPMSNVSAREALDVAMGKSAIAKSIYGNSAIPLNSFIPPFMWGDGPGQSTFKAGYAKLENTSAANIPLAKKLVAKAQLRSTAFTVAIGAGDEAGLQTLTYIQAAAKEIGLDMTIKQVQATQFSDMFYNKSARAGIDLIYALGYSEVASPLGYASYFAVPGGLFNWVGYNNPTVANELTQAREASSAKASAALFVKAQAAFVPQRLAIPVVSPDERLFLRKGISGAPSSFAYINMPWAAMIGAK